VSRLAGGLAWATGLGFVPSGCPAPSTAVCDGLLFLPL